MRYFGQHTEEELKEAHQAFNTEVDTWGDLAPLEWKEYRETGKIYNDHFAIQTALRVIMDRNDAAKSMRGAGSLGEP